MASMGQINKSLMKYHRDLFRTSTDDDKLLYANSMWLTVHFNHRYQMENPEEMHK